MKYIFAASSALALMSFATAGYAACDTGSVSDGDVLTCTGTDTDGVNQDYLSAGNLDDVEITVGAGAQVNNDTSGTEHVIELDDDGAISVSATGTITDLNGKDAVHVDNGFFIQNSGTISAGDDAVQAGNDLHLINHGVITAQDEGVNAEDDALITNQGEITAEDDAIKVGVNARINNYGLIENTGKDVSDPQDAVDIDQGHIGNYAAGIIRSTLDAAIDFDEGSFAQSSILNNGVIQGTVGVLTDEANLSSQKVENVAGTITGTSGVALDLGFGDDEVLLERRSVTNGDVDMGADNDLVSLDIAYGGAEINGDIFLGEGDDTLEFFNVDLFDTTFLEGTVDSFWAGEGYDTLIFDVDYAVAEAIFDVAAIGENWLEVTLGGLASYTFYDFDEVQFADQTFVVADYLPAVPLPAGVWLMLSGLFGFAGLRRVQTRRG